MKDFDDWWSENGCDGNEAKQVARQLYSYLTESLDSNVWDNGAFRISWQDEDKVLIEKPIEWGGMLWQFCVMDGGDFEYTLSALIAAYNSGRPCK